MHTLRRLGVFVFAASLACAGKSTPELPVDALYEPPAPIPIRVGLKSDNSLPSQLYGGAVIRDLKQMRLFEDLISPYNAHAQMDAKLKLFIERAETDQLDEFVLGLVDAGKPIRGAFAKPDPILTTRIPVGPDVGSGVLGTLKASNPSSVRAHARRLSNALAKKIYEDREALLEHLKREEAPPN